MSDQTTANYRCRLRLRANLPSISRIHFVAIAGSNHPEAKQAIPSLRIVHAVDGLQVGGTELNAVRTAIALSARGLHVSVAVFNSGPLAELLSDAGLHVEQFKIRSLKHWSAMRAAQQFATYCAKQRANVVHCHDVYTNSVFVLGARLAGVPLAIASRRWGLDQYGRALTRCSRLGYTFAHRVLANSESVGRSVVVEEGVARSKVVVVPNFIDDALWIADRDALRAALRSQLDISETAPLVSLVARLTPEKNHALALSIIARVRLTMPKARLLLVGDGPALESIREAIKLSALSDAVIVAGKQPSAWRYHAAADVALLTSTREGFPNSIIEAMAMGRPVIATDVGGVRDAVSHGRTGYVCDASDSTAMAAAIVHLLQNPDRANSMGAAARAEAHSRFSESVVVDSLLDIYARAVARKSPRRSNTWSPIETAGANS